MKPDISWLPKKALVAAATIAIVAGIVGFAGGEPCWEAEVSQSELRVVRASVTWREPNGVRAAKPTSVRLLAPREIGG
jgi:hypothetical protein